LSTELLDATLESLRLRLRFAQMLPKLLLVRSTGRHVDVRGERGDELLLLRVGLVEVLDQLCLTCRRLCHVSPLESANGSGPAYRGPNNLTSCLSGGFRLLSPPRAQDRSWAAPRRATAPRHAAGRRARPPSAGVPRRTA